MQSELWISAIFSAVCICAAIHFAVEASINRTQVRRLQAQRREDAEAREKGRMALAVEGLWPDLDEKQRLRDRIRELETDQSGEGGDDGR